MGIKRKHVRFRGHELILQVLNLMPAVEGKTVYGKTTVKKEGR